MGNGKKSGLGKYEQTDSFPVLVFRSQGTWCFAKRCLSVFKIYLFSWGRMSHEQPWTGQIPGQVAFYDGQLTYAEVGQRNGLKLSEDT